VTSDPGSASSFRTRGAKRPPPCRLKVGRDRPRRCECVQQAALARRAARAGSCLPTKRATPTSGRSRSAERADPPASVRSAGHGSRAGVPRGVSIDPAIAPRRAQEHLEVGGRSGIAAAPPSAAVRRPEPFTLTRGQAVATISTRQHDQARVLLSPRRPRIRPLGRPKLPVTPGRVERSADDEHRPRMNHRGYRDARDRLPRSSTPCRPAESAAGHGRRASTG